MSNQNIDYRKEYNLRFERGKEDYLNNFKELIDFTQSKCLYPTKAYHCLYTPHPLYKNKLDGLHYSIFYLSIDALICYVYELNQPCILTCGAVGERILKLEYLEINQQFPTDKNWTLGRLIYELDWKGTRITNEILDFHKSSYNKNIDIIDIMN